MPRKQNGFGSSQSFAFKGAGRVDKGKGVGAPGSYPGSRRYGSSVTRTVIEKYDLDSNWTKWRQGYEIWSKAYYSLLRVENPNYNDSLPEEGINIPYVPATLLSVLYQGTDYPTNVAFYGYEYPTMSADVNTHYVARRQPIKVDSDGNPVDISLGFVSQVFNDQLKYPEQKKFQEIWVKGTPNLRGRLLLQMVGERLTDGNTTATMKYLLGEPDRYCKDGVPAIYFGKTAPSDVRKNSDVDLQPTEVIIRIPKDSITLPQLSGLYRVNQGLSQKLVAPKSLEPGFNPQELVGKIVYMADFFKDRQVADFDAFAFIEDQTFFASFVQDSGKMTSVSILDPGVSQLPPSMYDIASLPQLLTTDNASYTLTGTYIFKKSDYQRFYGRNYLSADLVENSVTDASYSIFPFKILAVEDRH